MEEKFMSLFINVGVLDIRKPPEKPLGEVQMINVGTVLYYGDTQEQLRSGQKINVGRHVEASPDAVVYVDPVIFSQEVLEEWNSPREIVAFGPVLIAPGVTPKAVEDGLSALSLYGGPFVCPQELRSVMQNRIKQSDSQPVYYASPEAKMVNGRMVLDQSALDAMADQTVLLVNGPIRMTGVLPEENLRQKISLLIAVDGILCCEENMAVLKSLLSPREGREPDITVIPASYQLVEKPIALDAAALESMTNGKLYCTQSVLIPPEVKANLLDAKVVSLISKDRVYCPQNLKDVIFQKVDWLETQITFYEGELWLVADERQLPIQALESLDGLATLVVTDELYLDAAISADLIQKKLAAVHNLGMITGTSEQLTAVESKLGLNDGTLKDTTAKDKHEADHDHPKVHGDTEIRQQAINTPYAVVI
jgi:hypothetical protein